MKNFQIFKSSNDVEQILFSFQKHLIELDKIYVDDAIIWHESLLKKE